MKSNLIKNFPLKPFYVGNEIKNEKRGTFGKCFWHLQNVKRCFRRLKIMTILDKISLKPKTNCTQLAMTTKTAGCDHETIKCVDECFT